MARRRMAWVGVAMAGLAAAIAVVLVPSAASACSFAFRHDIAAVGSLRAGGTLQIVGRGFIAIEGEVTAACSGTYDFVPSPPVTVVVAFDTLSGPRSIALTAPVTGPRIPHEEAEPDFEAAYTIDVTTPIPPDAIAVTVGTHGAEDHEAIAGAVATTVPATPPPSTAPATTATPADAVAGDPTFTG